LSCEDLKQALRSLLPPEVSFAVEDPRAEATGLYPEERGAVARAVPKRRREFAAGRRAARTALAQLGQEPVPILAAQSRAPLWPKGFVGSISHCDDLCLAVCARADAVLSLGVDIEARAVLPDSLHEAITTPNERDWLQQSDHVLPIDVFSAKESAFKAIYPISQKTMDFQGFNIIPEAQGHFTAELRTAAAPFALGARFPLLSARLKAHVLFVAILEGAPEKLL